MTFQGWGGLLFDNFWVVRMSHEYRKQCRGIKCASPLCWLLERSRELMFNERLLYAKHFIHVLHLHNPVTRYRKPHFANEKTEGLRAGKQWGPALDQASLYPKLWHERLLHKCFLWEAKRPWTLRELYITGKQHMSNQAYPEYYPSYQNNFPKRKKTKRREVVVVVYVGKHWTWMNDLNEGMTWMRSHAVVAKHTHTHTPLSHHRKLLQCLSLCPRGVPLACLKCLTVRVSADFWHWTDLGIWGQRWMNLVSTCCGCWAGLDQSQE